MMSLIQAGRLLLDEVVRPPATVRVPEPMVMDDAEQVRAFAEAGIAAGIIAPTYLFHTAQASRLIRPGDKVIDLASGPGSQLIQLAKVNPQASFTGVELSPQMIAFAQEQTDLARVPNVTYQLDDITRLESIADHSIDVVVSCMSIHHLPGPTELTAMFRQVARVLKADGRVCLIDFCRLRNAASMEYFVFVHKDRQPDLFTQDYLHSVHAAFSAGEFREAMAPLCDRLRLYRMRPVSFLLSILTPSKQPLSPEQYRELTHLYRGLPPHSRRDHDGITRSYRLGGLSSPLRSGR